jgi:hypothetical protein
MRDQGEPVTPFDFVGRTAGVVGQAKNGIGVFGHGGPLTEAQSLRHPIQIQAFEAASLARDGGVFRTSRRQKIRS